MNGFYKFFRTILINKAVAFKMDLTNSEGDLEWQHYGISFLTSMRLKQERRNLVKVLNQLEKQRKKSLEMFEYVREQTEIDLEQRVKKRSTSLSELSRIKGKKESIAISRRESLNVLRARNGCVWNNALGRPTYGKRDSSSQKPQKKERKMTESVYVKRKKERDYQIQMRNAYFSVRPQTVHNLKQENESVRFPLLTRGFTDLMHHPNNRKDRNGLDMDYLTARWIAMSRDP